MDDVNKKKKTQENQNQSDDQETPPEPLNNKNESESDNKEEVDDNVKEDEEEQQEDVAKQSPLEGDDINEQHSKELSQVDLTNPISNYNEDEAKINSPTNVWETSEETLIDDRENQEKENHLDNEKLRKTSDNSSPNGKVKPPASPFFLKQLDVSDDIISIAPTGDSAADVVQRSSGKSKTKKTSVVYAMKQRGLSLTSNTSEKSENSFSRVSSAADDGSASNVKVVVRVRPFAPAEIERRDKSVIEFPGEGGIWIDQGSNQTKPFTFNTVFEENCSQLKVFEESGIKDLVEKALDGFSCTAFAFGQTGSGKTHTILGELQNGIDTSSGLVPRSIHYLFDCIASSANYYRIRASYLEVYNEKVKDLLNPSNTLDSLPVRWSTEKGFYVDNLFSAECECAEDLMEVLIEGSNYRQMGVHAMNDHSSRSHCMLIINIDSEEEFDTDGEPGFPITKHGKISFVDLAGSERVKETKTTGEALTESNNINKSLLTLGNCISALGDPRKKGNHIPYRESKLTKLLSDSLGGDGYTLMIACVSPSAHVLQDTMNTLRYANRAKNIKNKPVVKMDAREKLLQRLKRELKLLKAENSYFRQQLGVPYSELQIAMTPSQIRGDWTPEDKRELSPAIGSSAFSSIQSSRNNSSKDVFEHLQSSEKDESAMMTLNTKNGIYDILREFMSENENLKIENLELHRSRAVAQREQEEMSRENDRLTRKLDNLGRVMLSTPRSNENIRAWLSANQQQKAADSSDNEKTPTKVSRREELKFPPVRQGSYSNLVNTDSTPPVSNSNNRHDKNKVDSKIPLPDKKEKKLDKSTDVGKSLANLPGKRSPNANKVTQTADALESEGKIGIDNLQQQQQQSNKLKKSNRLWRKKKPPPPAPEKPSGYAAQFAARKELLTKQRVLTTDQTKKHDSPAPSLYNSYQSEYMPYNPYMMENQPFVYDWNYNYAMNGQPPSYNGVPVYLSYPGTMNSGYAPDIHQNAEKNLTTLTSKRVDTKRPK